MFLIQLSVADQKHIGLTSYTWSKAIDDVGGMIDVYNRRLNKALSAFDTPHQFIGSWVYRLPFGKGRMIGSSWNAIGNAILGGWRSEERRVGEEGRSRWSPYH